MQISSVKPPFRPYLAASNDIAELADPLNSLKINYFTFTRIDRSGGRIYLSNAPTLLEHYFRDEYYLVGNVEGDPGKYKQQVVMWDTLPNQFIYDEIPRANNFDHGLFMIEPHEDYCDFFGLATQKGNDRIINTYLTQMESLKKFTAQFTERADKLIHSLHENRVILPFNRDVIDFSLLNPDTPKTKLSKKQLEVTDVFLQGKKIKEIAQVLKISPRTVETHLNAIKNKLNCKNRTDLIIKLMHLSG